MRSPAAAIAWEFRERHRWGLIAVAGLPARPRDDQARDSRARADRHARDARSFALVVVVPLTTTFMYFLAVFSYGLAGDLAARQSMYPARLFTLPVTTAALAGWPMLYGTIAMAILWLVTRLFALWPSEFDVPVVWPALLAAALLAWTQALTWMPYGLPGLRVIVAMLWLATIDAIVLLGARLQGLRARDGGLPGAAVPLAYLAARFAVARARRGDVPDWRGTFARLGRSRMSCRAGAAIFIRPRARRRGSNGGGTAGRCRRWSRLLLPFELALLFAVRDTPALVFYTLFVVLVTPPFMAGFRRRDGEPVESGCARFLRRDAVHGDAAAVDAALIAAQAESDDLEHARRVGAAPRRPSAGAHPVRYLADGDRTSASAFRDSRRNAARGRDRAAGCCRD